MTNIIEKLREDGVEGYIYQLKSYNYKDVEINTRVDTQKDVLISVEIPTSYSSWCEPSCDIVSLNEMLIVLDYIRKKYHLS